MLQVIRQETGNIPEKKHVGQVPEQGGVECNSDQGILVYSIFQYDNYATLHIMP